MGEAKKRKDTEKAWRAQLDPAEQIIVATAEKLLTLNPTAGSCYRMALFMKLYLEEHHGISGQAIVGFVNDGTDDLYASHAWFEYKDQTTDIALAAPQHPGLQPAGRVIIHGFEKRRGWAYSYHKERPPEGLSAVRRLLSNPDTVGMMGEAEELHLTMQARSKSNQLIKAYLDGAPDGLTYDKMAGLIRGSN